MPIRVFCRQKNEDEELKCKKISDEITHISIPYNQKKFEFQVNQIWGRQDDQLVYETLIKKSTFSRNYWILFGFTGTGKTYTTMNILKKLLSDKQQKITVSAFQIYNNDIYDLLTNKSLKYFKTTKLVIRGKTNLIIEKEVDITNFLKKINDNRNQNKTNFNSVSSRSHALIEIEFGGQKYTIIDMAGQESGVQYSDKKLRNEGTNINLNMLALKECIRAFSKKSKFIPFRRTLLTFALKNMFSGNNMLSFICTISTEMPLYNQIDSLKYAHQLFDCGSSDLEFDYTDLIKDYNSYINECGWCNCQEIKIWREMSRQKYKNVRKIRTLVDRKLMWITQFKNHLIQYQKINPELNVSDNLDN